MAMNDVWYRDGLRFECTRCGACCTGAPGYVWLQMEEATGIADFLGEPLEQFLAMHTRMIDGQRSLREKSNGDCEFYDKEAGCTVYPVRPRQCRTWPFWESNVKTPESWAKACKVCPGSGKGQLISVEEISLRIRLTPL